MELSLSWNSLDITKMEGQQTFTFHRFLAMKIKCKKILKGKREEEETFFRFKTTYQDLFRQIPVTMEVPNLVNEITFQ